MCYPDRRTAGVVFGILLCVIFGRPFASPVSLSKKAMASVGLVVFGLVSFSIGK